VRYVDEYRDPAAARALLARIAAESRRPVRFMEFCGGHTHAVLRFGLRRLLAPTVRLSAGPGCPVCVTAAGDLDRAIALARVPGAILATFGDMVRVPGSCGTLETARAGGADVRAVTSPLDALAAARRHPERPVILLGVGFEATAPGVAATLERADAEGVPNLFLYSLHKRTLPAVRAVLGGGGVRMDGVIGPGHVAAVVGADAWRPVAEEYGVPCAVAGFEPLDILDAIARLVEMAEAGRAEVANAYPRSVRPEGNPAARAALDRVFCADDAAWRGLGVLPESGLALRPEFAHRDAAAAFAEALAEVAPGEEPAGCRCGDVLRGALEPPGCPLYRTACTPERPVGPCMVSSEGACAAHYRYGEAA
jgi:hydrogenase expression/formation protein HypD